MSMTLAKEASDLLFAFEEEWKRSSVPSIQTFLDRYAAANRTEFFHALLEVDVWHRVQTLKFLTKKKYLDLFPDFADSINAVFGLLEPPGYTFESILGKGGMGVVFKARQDKPDRVVALKKILAGEFADSREKIKFMYEAQAIADLNHPNIIVVYEVKEHGRQPYFTMEYAEGGSLYQRLRAEDPPSTLENQDTPTVSFDRAEAAKPSKGGARSQLQEPRYAAEVVASLAQGIQAAHDRGIIHRDLKPGNILLQTTGGVPVGVPKVVDFGLARRLDESQSTQGIKGTYAYMASEQTQGKSDFRTDVYGLGAILYEMLTGHPPISGGKEMLQVLHNINHQIPAAPRKENRAVPRDLETICLKSIDKDPAKRYQSARELAADLHRFLNGEPIHARPIPWWEKTLVWMKRNPGKAVAACTLLLFLIVVPSIVAYYSYEDKVKSDRFAADLVIVNGQTEEQRKLAVANAEEKEKQRKLAVDNAEEKEKQRKLAVANATEAVKQTKLAVANAEAKEEQRKLAVTFGTEADRQRKIALEKAIQLTVATGQRLLDDGDVFAALPYYVEAAGLEDADSPRLIAHQGRLATTLRQCPRLVQVLFHDKPVHHVEFDKDDLNLLSACQDGQVGVWDVATGKPRFAPFPRHAGPVHFATFNRHGTKIVSVSEDKTARLWDAVTGKMIGQEFSHRDPAFHAAFHPTEEDVFLTVSGSRFGSSYQSTMPGTGITMQKNPIGHVHVWDLQIPLKNDKQAPKQIIGHQGWINSAEFRPDGKAIIAGFSSMDKINGIAVHSLLAKEKSPPLRHLGHVLHVSVSPDGTRAVACGGMLEGTQGEARIWNLQTNELAVPPLKHLGQVVKAWFSPDGQRIVTASADQTSRLWDAKTGEPLATMAHKDRVNGAWFSPDGRWVLTASQDGSARVWNGFTGRPLTPFLKHSSPVNCGAFSKQGTLVALGCLDGTIRIWDYTAPMYDAFPLKTHAVLPPPPVVMSVGHSGSKTIRSTKSVAGRIATSAWFSPDSKYIFTGSGARIVDMAPGGGDAKAVEGFRTSHVCVWDPTTGKLAYPPRIHDSPFTNELLGPQGQWVSIERGENVFGRAKNQTLEICDITSGDRRGFWTAPDQERVKAVSLQADGTPLIVSLHGDPKAKPPLQTLLVRRGLEVQPPLLEIPVNDEPLDIALSPGGRHLALLASSPTPGVKAWQWSVQVWKLGPKPMKVGEPLILRRPVDRVSLSLNGDRVVVYNSGQLGGIFGRPAVANPESEAFLWEVSKKDPYLLVHKGIINDAHFSSTGNQVITCSQDRTARVWDAKSGQPLSPPLEHKDAVFYADVSVDGIVVTASRDSTACLWEMKAGERLAPPMPHPNWVTHASFSADGRRLVTACCDGSARVWDLQPAKRTLPEWRELTQLLSAHRIDASQGLAAVAHADLAKGWQAWRNKEAELFRRSPATNWNHLEWEQALQARDWWGVTVFGKRLSAQDPKNPNFQLGLARAHANLHQWREAEKAYTNFCTLGEDAFDIQYALVLLRSELERKSQPAQCELLAQRVIAKKKEDDPYSTTMLRACLVMPESLKSYDNLLQFLSPDMTKKQFETPQNKASLGAVYVRMKQWDKALEQLSDTDKRMMEAERTFILLFRCLALQGKKKDTEAQECLQQAKASWELAQNPPFTATPRPRPLLWTQYLELQILFREVAKARE